MELTALMSVSSILQQSITAVTTNIWGTVWVSVIRMRIVMAAITSSTDINDLYSIVIPYQIYDTNSKLLNICS
jgi:hypothetical protein